MVDHDVSRQPQTQAGAFALRCSVRLEHALVDLFFDAGPIIGNGDHHVAMGHFDTEAEDATLIGESIQRVENQV